MMARSEPNQVLKELEITQCHALAKLHHMHHVSQPMSLAQHQ